MFRCALVPLAAVTLFAGACTKGFHVEVRNDCTQPIRAELIHAGSGGKDEVRDSAHLGPGDRASLGEDKVPPAYRFLVRVHSPAAAGSTAELPLQPGHTSVAVSQDAPNQPLRMREMD